MYRNATLLRDTGDIRGKLVNTSIYVSAKLGTLDGCCNGRVGGWGFLADSAANKRLIVGSCNLE